MIYLIDDNKHGQMSANYKFDFTTVSEVFPGKIIWLNNLKNISLDDIITKSSSILIHDSLDDLEEKNTLITLAKIIQKPYCIFSNGFVVTGLSGKSITSINKDRFYNNLLLLIESPNLDYADELEILAFGGIYEVEKALIIQDRLVNGTLVLNAKEFSYREAFMSGSQDYNDLIELVKLSDPEFDFSEFDDKVNDENSISLLRKQIAEMVQKVKVRHER